MVFSSCSGSMYLARTTVSPSRAYPGINPAERQSATVDLATSSETAREEAIRATGVFCLPSMSRTTLMRFLCSEYHIQEIGIR